MSWSTLTGMSLEQAGRTMVGLAGLWHRPVHATEPVGEAEGARVPGGSGPVVLLGGMGETDPCLVPMVRWLERLGYEVTPYTLRAGMGCAQRTVDSLVRRVELLRDMTGEPVSIVGHSRGGQFGRAVAAQSPGSVSRLVTLGTPFDQWGGITPPIAALAWSLAAAGSAGVPGLLGFGCLVGACCRDFRALMRSPWPEDLPFVSIYSRGDRAVPWRSSHDPYARNIVVRGGHMSLLCSATAQRAVARALSAGPRADRMPGPEVVAA